MQALLAVVMAWAFERAQMIISAPNYSSPWNGFGCIDLVNEHRAKAPMAYRVLVPWLVWGFEKIGVRRIAAYQAWKITLESMAFYSVGIVFGAPAALLAALLLLLTIKYDYWDWAAEMFGIFSALSGNLELAMFGTAAHGLSRETVFLSPVAYFLKTGDMRGAVGLLAVAVVTFCIPRLWAGRKPLYCERWQVRYNLELFRAFASKEFWAWGQWFHQDIFIACALSGLAIGGALRHPQGVIALVALAAGWLMGKADETRIFSAALPWAAWLILGGA